MSIKDKLEGFYKETRLFFTDINNYKDYIAYKKIEKKFKNKMKKLLADFHPWSGWYMHEVITTMLTFYRDVYDSKHCVYAADEWRLPIVAQLKEACDYATNLEYLETMEQEELISIAEKDGVAFRNYVLKFSNDSDVDIKQLKEKSAFYSGLAYEYLSKKYTRKMYEILGNHIWDWCD